MTINQDIQSEVQKMGISLFGISDIVTPPNYDQYCQWVRNGCHASMKYLSRPDAIRKRKFPGLLMPSAKSMLILGFRYPHQGDEPLIDTPKNTGKFASYALISDYHDIIPEHLEHLVTRIKKIIGYQFEYRIYTDTGPILERDFGYLSGLGWIGKNSLLISPEIGSYFFLAEILISVKLESTEPFEKDFCGQCSRCIEACPTQCINPDRTIDARKCISFLTIENKEGIPRHLRGNLGTWIFGCDICQEVCPWNQKHRNKPAPSLFHERNYGKIDLISTLSLSNEQFKENFRGSPILRAKRSGLLRNILCALGTIKDPASIQHIANFLEFEENSMLREHAYWALGQFKNNGSKRILENWYQKEHDPVLRNEIKLSLAE